MPDSNNILVLEENEKGTDIVIGDVHGNASLLQRLIAKKLSDPNNRLFIVGDLIDRGEDSLAVVKKIMAINQARKKAGLLEQIYVVRGNHEDEFLNIRQGLRNGTIKKGAGEYQRFLLNGGGWIESKLVKPEDLKQIEEFIQALPYVIRVQGDTPFNIVHADMPLSDAELQKKIHDEEDLNEDEKSYATWARVNNDEVPIQYTGRKAYSTPTFCGHTTSSSSRDRRESHQRPETNTINLDVEACLTGAFIAVELSRQSKPKAVLFKGMLPTQYCGHLIPEELKEEQIQGRIALAAEVEEINNNLKTAFINISDMTAEKIDEHIRNQIMLSHNAKDSSQEIINKTSKAAYIEMLMEIMPRFSKEQKEALVQHLINNQDKHMLAKERHFFRSGYSIQTKSMHEALGLLGAVKQKDDKFIVSNNSNSQEQELTRHTSLFGK
jgi:predicted phosphodiesterase